MQDQPTEPWDQHSTIDRFHNFDQFAQEYDVQGAGVLSAWIAARDVMSSGSLPPPRWNPERTHEWCVDNEDLYHDDMTFASDRACISIVAEHRFKKGEHVSCQVTCFREGKCIECQESYEESSGCIPTEWLEDVCERCA
jgi:hypothetical protein